MVGFFKVVVGFVVLGFGINPGLTSVSGVSVSVLSGMSVFCSRLVVRHSCVPLNGLAVPITQ